MSRYKFNPGVKHFNWVITVFVEYAPGYSIYDTIRTLVSTFFKKKKSRRVCHLLCISNLHSVCAPRLLEYKEHIQDVYNNGDQEGSLIMRQQVLVYQSSNVD